MAELKKIRIAVSGIYDYALEELPSLRLPLPGHGAPEWVERKSVYKVYRPAVVLAKAADKFKMLPLTHGHPTIPVDGRNFRELAVGYTGENPEVEYLADSDEVGIRSTAILYDDEALGAYDAGEIQLSPGYVASFAWKRGKAPDGREYDIIMDDIESVNHLAILRNGRGGEYAVVLDGAAEADAEEISLFEFIAIRRELAEYLEGLGETEDRGKPEGSVSHRKDGDYRKQGGKWYKIYEREGRGASIAAAHVAKKVRNAQSVDELMDIVMKNTSRFTGADGRLLPVVERLKAAVDKRKGELNAGKPTMPQNSAAAPAPSTPKMPDVISGGHFNGKIYGNAKFGYRVYVGGKERKITPEQKKELDEYAEAMGEYEKKRGERADIAKKEAEAKEGVFANLGASDYLYLSEKFPEEAEKRYEDIKNMSPKEFFSAKRLDALEKKATTDEERLFINRLRADDSLKERTKAEFIGELDKRKKKREEEKAQERRVAAERVARDSRVSEYIKEHGEPDIVKGRYWNGVVYGSERWGYHVYVDGKKKFLSKSDKAQFGL